MELLEQLRWDVALLVVACAWLGFAEHPTARGFRAAVIDTLDL